jgi:hypothetical protein
LKKVLKEDVWKLIDGEKPREKTDEFFVLYVFYLFLEKKQFLMEDVIKFAGELKERYYNLLEDCEGLIQTNFGDVLKLLEKLNGNYDTVLKPIERKVEKLRVVSEACK